MTLARLALLGAIAASAAGCGECMGTLTCKVAPELSNTGQILDHLTGQPVGGTTVTFVRDSGIVLDADTISATTDGEGYFTLRVGAAVDGIVRGHLVVDGPGAPAPHTVRDIALETTRTIGAGKFLGRFTVQPYLRFIGMVRDRLTLVAIPGVTVTLIRNSGARMERDTMTFLSDHGGVVAWHPAVLDAASGRMNVTFELSVPGHARTYRFTRDLDLSMREGETILESLPVGLGLPYYIATVRRGLGLSLSGTTVELTRVSGVPIQPNQRTIAPNQFGSLDLELEPQAPGSLYVQMRLIPPTPIPQETRILALATSDDDKKIFLGSAGYGAHAGFQAQLRDSVTGAILPDQTPVRIRRVSGLPMLWPNTPPPQGDFRVVNRFGLIEYSAPTSDTGSITYDVTVELPAPFAWDTIRGIVAPSRFNDTLPTRGPFLVRRRPRT